MLPPVMLAVALIAGVGGAVLMMPAERYEARFESRATHIAAAQATSAAPLAAQPTSLLHRVGESCDAAPTPMPTPTQARAPATPARQDI